MNRMSNIFVLCSMIMTISSQVFATIDSNEELSDEKQAQKIMLDSALEGGIAGSIGTLAGKIITALCFPRHGSHLIPFFTNMGLGLTYYATLQQTGSKLKFVPYIIGHLFGSAATTGVLHVGKEIVTVGGKFLHKK